MKSDSLFSRMGPSRRAIRRIYIGLVIGVAAVVVLLVWPGFITTYSCAWSIDPTTSVNGQAYCHETMPQQIPPPELGLVLPTSHYEAWGFMFSVAWLDPPCGLNISVTEPTGSTYSDDYGLCYVVPPDNGSPPPYQPWFTPDGMAGVLVTPGMANVSINLTLYVEK